MLAQNALPPLDRDKAQYTLFVGKKRPVAGWPAGAYSAAYRVTRSGKVVVERTFAIRL